MRMIGKGMLFILFGICSINGAAAAPTTVAISGRIVRNDGGLGLDQVTVAFTDGSSVTTTNGGYYTNLVSSGWTGTATVSYATGVFSPASRTYLTAVTNSKTAQNYTWLVPGYVPPLPPPPPPPPPFVPTNPMISGRITRADNGVGVYGVTVCFISNDKSTNGTAVTTGGGYYSNRVTYGWSGTTTVSYASGTISPASKSYLSAVISDQTSQNYSISGLPTVSLQKLFWQAPTGQITEWTLNVDGLMSSWNYVYNIANSLRLRGVGDLDDDGVADLVLQTSAGKVTGWILATNDTTESTLNINTNLTPWQIRCAGDIDKDGIADLIWQAATGQTTCWFMKTNGDYRAWTYVNPVATAWKVAAAGDVDGDGVSDLIWQAPTGQATCWFMKTNGDYRAWTYINNSPTTWKIRCAGDIDRDGIADLVWQAPTGQVTCWFMNTNGVMVSWGYINRGVTPWQVTGVGSGSEPTF